MQLVRGLYNWPLIKQPCVATIGNFDGVHLGHQQLLKHLAAKASELRLPAIVITFEPQPNEYFSRIRAQQIPARLMRLREKIVALQNEPIQFLLILPFNAALAQLSAEQFITDILLQKLNVRHLVVGDDFRFGHRRAGDIRLLQEFAEKFAYTVEQLSPFNLEGERVSSTRIRLLLQQGDFILANQLLGKPFTMSGVVIRGKQLGRTWSVPTANVDLHRHAVPLHGIYLAKVHQVHQQALPAVVSIGTRPAVGGDKVLLEAHLLNFSGDLYGAHIKVEFLEKLRDEQNFATLELLQKQIIHDVQRAHQFFSLPPFQPKDMN